MSETVRIAPVGLSGVLVSFASEMDPRANRAAIAFRAVLDAQAWPEVRETSSTLVSTFLSVDLVETAFEEIEQRLRGLLGARDWLCADLPNGRKTWRLPMCFDGEYAPQLEEAAHAAGVGVDVARAELLNSETQVITVGYAPGQPYLGMLPEVWDIPRQAELTPRVPAGALVVAIRQFVLFTAGMPTGWRQVGQTAFRPFDPAREMPIAFSPGDEVRFVGISGQELKALEQGDTWGGATWSLVP